MGIKQYLLVYLRDLILKFTIHKYIYTPTNIRPASVDGHNFLMIQSENYNCIMILLQLLIDLSHVMTFWYFLSFVNSFFNRARSHPDVWFLVGPFVYFHTLCMRTAKALARLRGYAGSTEPLLVACVISTIISWAGSFNHNFFLIDDQWHWNGA